MRRLGLSLPSYPHQVHFRMRAFAADLAERAADGRLVARCKRLFWVWIVGGLIVIGVGGATDLYNSAGQPWPEHHGLLAVVALGVVMVLLAWLWIETLLTARMFLRAMRAIG